MSAEMMCRRKLTPHDDHCAEPEDDTFFKLADYPENRHRLPPAL
jgi:hypothetical protein